MQQEQWAKLDLLSKLMPLAREEDYASFPQKVRKYKRRQRGQQ
jgi:hypothetical protein